MQSALFIALLVIADKPDSGDGLASVKAELGKASAAYHIRFFVEPNFPHGLINGKIAKKDDLASYTGLFVKEFFLYPPALVKRSKLRQVILCKDLSWDGQFRAAIPDSENDALYLDVARYADNKQYLREGLHHDFFHMIVYQEQGMQYGDERWASLNPTNFKYGTGGASAQHIATTGVLTDKFPGFLNHYSTTAVEEDKAEVFANLLVEPARVEKRIKEDAVLRAKVKLMKERLAKFCPDVDDVFWEKAKKTKR